MIAVVGEALIDRVRYPDGRVTEFPGGSAANVAVAIGRLGVPVQLITELGDDADGALIRDWLRRSVVEAVVSTSASGRTSSASAVIGTDGSAEYEFDIAWDLPPIVLPPTAILHVGSVGSAMDPGARTVADMVLRAGGALVTFDPNVRPSITPDREAVRARAERLVAAAGLVKASDDDLRWLYPDATPLESARAWSAAGPGLVVVTHAEGGATAVSSSFEVSVPATPVEVVDTVGAGDTFTGAMLAQIAVGGIDLIGTERAVAEMVRRSAVAASITVARAGANPPWAFEVPDIFPTSVAGGSHVPA